MISDLYKIIYLPEPEPLNSFEGSIELLLGTSSLDRVVLRRVSVDPYTRLRRSGVFTLANNILKSLTTRKGYIVGLVRKAESPRLYYHQR